MLIISPRNGGLPERYAKRTAIVTVGMNGCQATLIESIAPQKQCITYMYTGVCMDVFEEIKHEVHLLYWNKNINCARTMMMVLSKLFNYRIEEQMLNSGIGMHGAGGYRAQCGLVEGSLMFIGAYFSEKGQSENKISHLCYNFAKLFDEHFGSLTCKDLRPNGFNTNDPPHLCENITSDSILFTYKYIHNVMNSEIAKRC